jgi:hypothetical protein
MPEKKVVRPVFAESQSSQCFEIYDEALQKKDKSITFEKLKDDRTKAEVYFEKILFANGYQEVKWKQNLIYRPKILRIAGEILWEFIINYTEYYYDKKLGSICSKIKDTKIFSKETPTGMSDFRINRSPFKGYNVKEISEIEYEQGISACITPPHHLKVLKLNGQYELHETDSLKDVIRKIVSYFEEAKEVCTPYTISNVLNADGFNYGRFLKLDELKPQGTYSSVPLGISQENARTLACPNGIPFLPSDALPFYLDQNRELLGIRYIELEAPKGDRSAVWAIKLV